MSERAPTDGDGGVFGAGPSIMAELSAENLLRHLWSAQEYPPCGGTQRRLTSPIHLPLIESAAYNPPPADSTGSGGARHNRSAQGEIAMKGLEHFPFPCSGRACRLRVPSNTAVRRAPGMPAVAVAILAALLGCKSTAGPCWCHPGSAKDQQTRALRYDPYPISDEPDAAMAGVRPRDYDVPPPQTSRARWQLGNWGQ